MSKHKRPSVSRKHHRGRNGGMKIPARIAKLVRRRRARPQAQFDSGLISSAIVTVLALTRIF